AEALGRVTIESREPGTITLQRVSPPGADAAPLVVCRTPCRVDVVPGRYVVHLRLGADLVTTRIEISSGESHYRLRRRIGQGPVATTFILGGLEAVLGLGMVIHGAALDTCIESSGPYAIFP